MNTLRKLQAYCKSRAVCRGCKLAHEAPGLPGLFLCAFDDCAPALWELDRFEEEIKEIVGKEDVLK